jgi:outer membrane protein W
MRMLLVVVFISILAGPLVAQSNEVSVLAGSTSVSTTKSDATDIQFDNASAVGLAYNRFWTDSISTELSVLRSSHDGSVRFAGERLLDLGSLDLTTIAAIAQFHFIRSRTVDVYAGAGVANITADDLESTDLRAAGVTNISVDSSTSWIANAGAAYTLGHGIAVGIDGRYVRYRPDSTSTGGEPVTLDLDPLTIALALKLRF